DDADLLQTMKLRLEAGGSFLVKTAQSGEAAIKLVEAKVPDLIITDVLMPDMDGYTTLREINKVTERKVPVIVTTGKAIMMKDTFEMEGAKAFFIKPIDGNELVKKVKEILGS
ncbi:MAG: response regulator, partial [Candidatus Omnitrophica bacterium]|nr:response regulator [Candidatus Omnitrophota bacterium]